MKLDGETAPTSAMRLILWIGGVVLIGEGSIAGDQIFLKDFLNLMGIGPTYLGSKAHFGL
jgi:hypothetical protein